MEEQLDNTPVGPRAERWERMEELAVELRSMEQRERVLERWILDNVTAPEWGEKMNELHWLRRTMNTTQRRITNLQECQPEMGHMVPTATPNKPTTK
jgi:hypothetical protein